MFTELITCHGNHVSTIAFSPINNEVFAVAGGNGNLELWNTEGKQIASLRGHIHDINSLAYSADGEFLLSSAEDKTIKLWFIKKEAKKIRVYEELKSEQKVAKNVAFFSDFNNFFLVGDRHSLTLFDYSFNQIAETKCEKLAHTIGFGPNGKLAISYSSGIDSLIKLYNVSDSKSIEQIASFWVESTTVQVLGFSRDGKVLAAGSTDGIVRLRDLQSHQMTKCKGHADWIKSISFSPDSNILATGSDDRTARLWDLHGNQIAKLGEYSDQINTVSFNKNGNVLAIGSNNGIVRLLRQT